MNACAGPVAPAMKETNTPAIRSGIFRRVVRKNSARHGAPCTSSLLFVAWLVTDFGWLSFDSGRLPGFREFAKGISWVMFGQPCVFVEGQALAYVEAMNECPVIRALKD
jgi:hypothetical protein